MNFRVFLLEFNAFSNSPSYMFSGALASPLESGICFQSSGEYSSFLSLFFFFLVFSQIHIYNLVLIKNVGNKKIGRVITILYMKKTNTRYNTSKYI